MENSYIIKIDDDEIMKIYKSFCNQKKRESKDYFYNYERFIESYFKFTIQCNSRFYYFNFLSERDINDIKEKIKKIDEVLMS